MVKVLNIISDKNVGGAGRVLLNYLKYCDRANFRVSVALPTGSFLIKPLRELSVDVHAIDITPDRSFCLSDVKKLRQLIKKTNPDIVHTHGSLSGRIAGRLCRKTVVFTRHSVFPISPWLRAGPGRFLNRFINEQFADRIIAVSPAAKKNLTDSGISRDLIDVVMNGVEPLTAADEGEKAHLRAEYNIGEDDFTAGILARFEHYKGHLIILEAARKLLSEGRKIKILMAGAGPFEAEVKARASELGLEDAVTFVGFLSDVSSFLSILDVQLNASYGTEATSLSLLEGMSLGLPAVVSDYGGNPWLIENGKTGLVFKSCDSADLAGCIAQLMDDPQLMRQFEANAKETYESRYTGSIHAKQLERVYQHVLEGAHHGT